MKKCFLTLSILLISLTGFAKSLDGDAWMGALNIGMYSHTVDNAKFDATMYDITVGYIRSKGLYLGGIFGSCTVGDDTCSNMGLSLGYIKNGWDLMIHAFLAGTYKSSTNYPEGTGTQFDIGYMFKTGSAVFVGFQISSRSMTYKPKTGADLKIAEMYPAFKVIYPF